MEVKLVFIGTERDVLTNESIPVYELKIEEEGSQDSEDNESSGS